MSPTGITADVFSSLEMLSRKFVCSEASTVGAASIVTSLPDASLLCADSQSVTTPVNASRRAARLEGHGSVVPAALLARQPGLARGSSILDNACPADDTMDTEDTDFQPSSSASGDDSSSSSCEDRSHKARRKICSQAPAWDARVFKSSMSKRAETQHDEVVSVFADGAACCADETEDLSASESDAESASLSGLASVHDSPRQPAASLSLVAQTGAASHGTASACTAAAAAGCDDDKLCSDTAATIIRHACATFPCLPGSFTTDVT